LVGPTIGKIVLQRQTWHADAVAGLPLPGLCRSTEPVQSTRLQTFLTVLNFQPLSRYLEMMAFAPSPCSRSLHAQFVVVREFSHWQVLSSFKTMSLKR